MSSAWVLPALIGPLVAGTLAQLCGQRGIGQEAGEHGGESGRIRGTERETDIPKNFNEGAEIGGNNRQSPQHIFRDHQTENFPAKRRNHDYGRLAERGFQPCTVKPASEANLRIQLRLAREILQRCVAHELSSESRQPQSLQLEHV